MTVIMLPTWNLAGITFNTIDADGVEWIVDKDEGWDAAPGPRLSMADKAVGHGSYDGQSWLEPRTIVLSGRIIAPTRSLIDGALRRIAAIGGDGARSVLTVAEPDVTLTAEVRLAVRTDVLRQSTTLVAFQLSLVAPDPRKYGTVHESSTGLASAAPGGVPWNGTTGTTGVEWNGPTGTTGVQWQSGVGVTGIVTAVNNGNFEASVELVITAGAESISNPTVTDVTTQQVISYGGTIPVGSTLIIDTGPGSVLLDGADRGALLSRADWLTVPRQSARQFLFTSSSTSPTASLMVRSQDTYI